MLSNRSRPLSSLRRMTRASRIADDLRPKSFSGGTKIINGTVYTLHPTKGYRKDRALTKKFNATSTAA